LSVGIIDDGGNNFWMKLIDGKLSLYQYEYTDVNFGTPMMSTTGAMIGSVGGGVEHKFVKVVHKEGAEFVKIKYGSFKKKMIKYLSDCPEIVDLLKEDSYTSNEVESMVKYYNMYCK
jgi:hypothetical protein